MLLYVRCEFVRNRERVCVSACVCVYSDYNLLNKFTTRVLSLKRETSTHNLMFEMLFKIFQRRITFKSSCKNIEKV